MRGSNLNESEPKTHRKKDETEEADAEVESKSGSFISRSRSQSSSAPSTRRITPTTTAVITVTVGEKRLLNGDFYSGSFSGSVPHGAGKYLWTDGCMYEGEWRRGKAAGKGKFSWPSGATFEGEFRAGRMEGLGTYTGSEGDTYSGAWAADRKHGFGEKSYSNGDYYEGSWRRNLQEGHGRYVWKNGNQYVGEWKNGVISGRGVLIWANGNRYDGQWENGVPKGNGVFRWPDGSVYVGSWNKDCPKNRELNGTFYPGNNAKEKCNLKNPFAVIEGNLKSPIAVVEENLEILSWKRCSVDEATAAGAAGRGSLAERTFPRICIWESDGEKGDITCDIIDNVEASMYYRDGTNVDHDVGRDRRRSPCCFKGGEGKKPGQMISKGHKNYDLMLNLQLGIRYSVGKPANSELLGVRTADFDPKEKYWTRFPPEGSKVTPPHPSIEFRWKDYCPMVFRHLRKLFAIDPADYMLAICGNDALRELSSPGKSGSYFYLTQDDRFMIKTVKKSEVKVLLRMLQSYYQHVSQYENSLVTKFFGVHCVKPVGSPKVRFIVMGNLFCSEYPIHRRFDLKGSSHGRTTDKPEGEIDENTTLKDLDLNFVFQLQKFWFDELLRQIDLDCKFLEREGIMDYSLLVGLHFCDDDTAAKMGMLQFVMPSSRKGSWLGERGNSEYCFLESGKNMDPVPASRKPLIRLGANMPATAVEVRRRSDFDQYQWSGGESTPGHTGETYDVILYFGIIDILQDYDISKKLEHAYKSLQADPTSISAVDPKLYSKRFRDFIRRHFVEDAPRK